MPNSAMRPCSYPGCNALVRSGRCEQHPMDHALFHNPEHQKLYNTARWRRRSQAQLIKQPWCEACLRANVYTAATESDHVERHNGDVRKFFGGRLQSLCASCHSRKTAGEVFA
jgi:5-methylcytosine-specific restriction protein A